MSRSVPEVFAAAVAVDPARPLLTYYDDATGERTELSGATLDNWVAKTANLLVDGHGLGPADSAAVRLPPHWQTAAVLLGCWSAGIGVGYGGQAEIEFVTADGMADTDAPDVYVLGLAPLAAPMRPAPPGGYLDYVVEVRGYGDRFAPPERIAPDVVALWDPRAASHQDLVHRAVRQAGAQGITAGDRVLLDAAHRTDPVDWLLTPLVAGASIVLCGHLDRAKLAGRLTEERVTHELS